MFGCSLLEMWALTSVKGVLFFECFYPFSIHVIPVLCDHLYGQVTLTRRPHKYGRALCFTSHVSCNASISCSLTLREIIYLVPIHYVSLLDLLAMFNLYYLCPGVDHFIERLTQTCRSTFMSQKVSNFECEVVSSRIRLHP